MNESQSRCNDARLLELIHDRLNRADTEATLSHIEACARCRQRMDELSADSHHWTKTVKVLLDSQLDSQLDGRQAQSPTVSDSSAASWPWRAYRTISSKTSSADLLSKQLLLPPSHPEMLGRLGRYEVERLIGSGGMGVVFKAFDTELNRPVAIKVLALHLANCGSARKRFAREARAAAAVVNEHVVPIHNVEIEGETPFLVMQYIDGESLQARLDREGPLELEEILRIAMQVAAGLAAAHQQGLVHRDIKPANILLEHGIERALITDFGLARAADDANLTQSGFHAGTPQYMSPEQVAGQVVDCSSDLFSLGSVVYAMCTGRPPFRSEHSLGVLKRIAEDTPRSIHEINPRVPLWLESIVTKLLTKRAEQRPQSAALTSQIFAQCLQHLQNSSGGPLPEIVVGWMREIEVGSRLDGTTKGSLASRLSTMFAKRQRLAVAAIGLLVIGAVGVIDWTPYWSGDAHYMTHGEPLDATRNLQSPPSALTLDQNEPLDPELEWNAAMRATRTLQLETDLLEHRIKQDLDP